MKVLLVLGLLISSILHAQNSPDLLKAPLQSTNADDPANFLTRVEVYNELQHFDNDVYLNQTVLRNIVQIGKRFSTRLDVPVVYNSAITPSGQQHFGIGDISFRLLGYKIIEDPKRAITASIEISLNTAQSRILGTGKNMLIPLISYSTLGGAGFAGLPGGPSNPNLILPPRVLASLVNNTGSNSVDLNITGIDTIRWNGSTAPGMVLQ